MMRELQNSLLEYTCGDFSAGSALRKSVYLIGYRRFAKNLNQRRKCGVEPKWEFCNFPLMLREKANKQKREIALLFYAQNNLAKEKMMTQQIAKRRRYPSLLEAIMGEEELFPEFPFAQEGGISLSEDERNVFLEAALPGLKPEEIEVTFDKGMLWIKGEKREEEENRKRKFYRKAVTNFSYHLTLPESIDNSKEPKAMSKNGILYLTFEKKERSEPKKIRVQSE